MRAPASHAGCSSPPCRSSGTVMLSASAHQPRGAPRPQRCSKARGACNPEGQGSDPRGGLVAASDPMAQAAGRRRPPGARGAGAGPARGRAGAARVWPDERSIMSALAPLASPA